MSYLGDFVHLFYPLNCAACGASLFRQEKALCLRCYMKLPRAQLHDQHDNVIERLFWGRADVQMATAFLRMSRHGMVHRMIHELKYRDNQPVGEQLGKMFALELKESRRMNAFDMVVPVPLHPRKEKMRGYNQCHSIARGIQSVLECDVDTTHLVRTAFSSSQTRKGRYERWQNVGTLFEVKDADIFRDRKILLIDDVITTGATLEACAQVLNAIGGVQLAVGALAYPV